MKYVDLGLPSGTLWSESPLTLGKSKQQLFSFGSIPQGISLPSEEQIREFSNYVTIRQINSKLLECIGPKGKLCIPVLGYKDSYGIDRAPSFCYIWSKTIDWHGDHRCMVIGHGFIKHSIDIWLGSIPSANSKIKICVYTVRSNDSYQKATVF